jgi:tetratricopeptide (TPR) repeat protein
MAVDRDSIAENRLDSWKEIASFLGRGERTVKRWETERGLPVRRVPGRGRSAVFAYPHELADWLKGSQDLDSGPTSVALEAEEELPSALEAASQKALASPTRSSAMQSSAIEPSVTQPLPVGSSVAPGSANHRRIALWLPLLITAVLLISLASLVSLRRFKHPAGHASSGSSNPEAQDLYLKGRYFWNRRTPEDLTNAVGYFTQAIVKDPTNAQAYVGLADSYNLLREFGAMSPAEAYPRALAAAQRAVELDDTSAEAHNSLAFVSFWWSWQGVTAEREFKRALQLDPNFVRGHHWYATFLFASHRTPEALVQIEQAQRLDPSSTAILADKGYLLWSLGRHNEALTLLEQLETTDSSMSSIHNYLGIIAWSQKDYPRAITEWRKLAELRHDQTELAIAEARAKGLASGGLHGLLESQLPLEKELVDRGSGSAYDLAATYAALGNKKEALAYLQIAFDRRDSSMITGDPPIPELHGDPTYQKLTSSVDARLAQ